MIEQLLSEVRSDIAGIKTLNDWLGEGGDPVSHELAEQRALICARCPMNIKGHWWVIIKSAMAMTIRAHIEVKTKLQLQTIHDSEIGTCKVCRCNLPLLVHAPAKVMKENLPEGQLEEFPPNCWKAAEIKAL
jgi:hypothetical protein